MRKRPGELVLAYDLGGTKVAVGVVDAKGRILAQTRVPVRIADGKTAVLNQLAELGLKFLRDFPEIKQVGLASAGPLDPLKGVLLDPTNFVGPKGPWGPTPIVKFLEKKLKRPVRMENDAAAAILAERWLGAARGIDNAMILTLGTGLGTAVIANGELIRAGRGLHTEAGHMIIREGDRDAVCGCGNLGCAEALLSGNGFARWVKASKRMGGKNLSAVELAALARSGDKRALKVFEEMGHLLAIAIHNFVMLFTPELFILTGSFAGASDLFLKTTRVELKRLLARHREGVDLLPKIVLSPLDNDAGLLGGAVIALPNQKR